MHLRVDGTGLIMPKASQVLVESICSCWYAYIELPVGI